MITAAAMPASFGLSGTSLAGENVIIPLAFCALPSQLATGPTRRPRSLKQIGRCGAARVRCSDPPAAPLLDGCR